MTIRHHPDADVCRCNHSDLVPKLALLWQTDVRVSALATATFDLLVIGGGVNGAAIARDAAGRGLRVLLAEKDDLAAHTSSASTKLIHGGLRYLEFYEFRLVREALQEREIILARAPHITWPLRFVLPHEPSHRPAWMVRIGLFLYDHLARRRTLKGTETIHLRQHVIGRDLRDDLSTAFLYSDGWVDDSRLVLLTALDAAERGAVICTRTAVTAARRHADHWSVTLAPRSGHVETVTTRLLVNAAGPWAGDILQRQLAIPGSRSVRLVKGSHIVVPRLYNGDHAFIFQNNDNRIVFAIPYEGVFTLIGTTDIPFHGDPSAPHADDTEIAYLCAAVNAYFKRQLSPADVVWTFCGVRPLFDDGALTASKVSRDYVLDLDAPAGSAPVLTVFGGKITTHRELALRAMAALRPYLPHPGADWTAAAPLPGGDIPNADISAFTAMVRKRWPFLGEPATRRLVRAYGTRLERILGSARSAADLGDDFGCGFSAAELAYLVREEWARTAEDVLWRRSKLGLHLPSKAQDDVKAAIERLAPGNQALPRS